MAAPDADVDVFAEAVYNSLDRKVCNTLNTCCIVADRASDLVPAFLAALDRAGERRGAKTKLHVVADHADRDPRRVVCRSSHWASRGRRRGASDIDLVVGGPRRTNGNGKPLQRCHSPIVDSVDHAVDLFNRLSPRFAASLVSQDADQHRRFFERIDAPFVGNGFTRWVDGQYALDRPELGLSNWEFGRLFGRGGVLSGDSVFTVRSRVTQTDPQRRPLTP